MGWSELVINPACMPLLPSSWLGPGNYEVTKTLHLPAPKLDISPCIQRYSAYTMARSNFTTADPLKNDVFTNTINDKSSHYSRGTEIPTKLPYLRNLNRSMKHNNYAVYGQHSVNEPLYRHLLADRLLLRFRDPGMYVGVGAHRSSFSFKTKNAMKLFDT